MRILKISMIVVGISLLLTAGGFLVWSSTPLGPAEEALETLSSATVIVEQQNAWIGFFPKGEDPKLGLVFYPGGRVDFRSYAPLAESIAEEGFIVIIPKMTLNLAVFNPDAADRIIHSNRWEVQWVIGGHSLGGAMAARYADLHRDRVGGLVLVAAYPARDNDLSDSALPVLSIYGSVDGLASGEKITTSRELLPVGTEFFPIDGGNHAQMGAYGPQPGDRIALISWEQQQSILTSQIVRFLESLKVRGELSLEDTKEAES